MKKGFIKKCMVVAMSVCMAAGGVLGYSNVYAANAFKAGDSIKVKYVYNNKVSTKKAIDARWNNKIINTEMPGYQDENGNAMYSAYWIFGKSGMGASYKSSGKTITITRSKTTVKMTLDSKTAYVNGKKATMSTAPRKVYYYGKKANYIMVPGEWTAKKLGLEYKWNKTSKAGCMNAPKASSSTTTAAKPTTTASKPTTTTTETKETTTGNSGYVDSDGSVSITEDETPL